MATPSEFVNVKNEALAQILTGDIILLNKVDLVNKSTLSALTNQIKTLNPTATLIEMERGNFDINMLWNFQSSVATEKIPAYNDLIPSSATSPI